MRQGTIGHHAGCTSNKSRTRLRGIPKKGNNIPWEYESLPGVKKPDYVVPCAFGKCIVEVKEIENPQPWPTHGFEPDRPVRAKMKSARKQLSEYKDLPCSLAIYSESAFAPHEPSVLLAAMFGPG